MKNVVWDTNFLLACIAKSSSVHVAWSGFLNEEFRLCITNEIISEYEEVLAYKTSPQFAEIVVRLILSGKNTVFIHPSYRFGLITADPDDNKFVDCAIVANADYIVSQDKHFNILKTIDFPKVMVIEIDEFIKDLKADQIKRRGF